MKSFVVTAWMWLAHPHRSQRRTDLGPNVPATEDVIALTFDWPVGMKVHVEQNNEKTKSGVTQKIGVDLPDRRAGEEGDELLFVPSEVTSSVDLGPVPPAFRSALEKMMLKVPTYRISKDGQFLGINRRRAPARTSRRSRPKSKAWSKRSWLISQPTCAARCTR